MKRLITAVPAMVVLVVHMGSAPRAAAPPGPFFNGFEQNTDGWFDASNGGDGTITRRPSGYSNGGGYADGIASAAGRWHARLTGSPCFTPPNQDCTGPFTRWGGYTSMFPVGGYLTQVDIYLDVAWAQTHPDTRFDWISAINQSTPPSPPVHRRDWVFNAGTQLPGDPIGKFIVNASTNAFRDSSFPENPCPSPVDPIGAPPAGCRMPVPIARSGWYTFRHTFTAGSFTGCPEATCLIVDFDIFDRGTGANVAHWRIDSAQDPMSLVGGNRYGWFANEEIPDLPIDNSLRTGLCHRGDGDGDAEDKDGHKRHVAFHENSCGDGSDRNEVDEDDDSTNDHFQSASITSATFTSDESSQTMTIVGTGNHNGLPVGFTFVAVDNGTIGAGTVDLILTDGSVLTGSLPSGTILIQ